MDLDRYREDSLDAWDRFSGNWDEEHDFLWEHTRPVSERLVERLDPRPGDTVLELAAGTGDTGFLVGERVGDQGRVISTDFAPGMVEVARRRVLGEGGRVSFAVWAGPDQNLWAAVPGIALMERGHLPAPEPGAPGIFALADPDRIRELVRGAGFGEPSIEQVPVDWAYGDSAEHWEKTLKLAAPIAEAVNGLAPEQRDEVRTAVAGRIDELLAGPGVNGVAHVVVAEQ